MLLVALLMSHFEGEVVVACCSCCCLPKEGNFLLERVETQVKKGIFFVLVCFCLQVKKRKNGEEKL